MLEWLEDEDPAASEELKMPEALGLGGDTVVGRKVQPVTAGVCSRWRGRVAVVGVCSAEFRIYI